MHAGFSGEAAVKSNAQNVAPYVADRRGRDRPESARANLTVPLLVCPNLNLCLSRRSGRMPRLRYKKSVPDTGMLLLKRGDLPPYAHGVQRETQIPGFDFASMV